MKQMGYREGYRYAHDEPNGYAAGQTYFPEGVARPGWYQPTDRASSEGWEKGLLGCARSMTRRRQARTLDRHPPRNRPIATSRTTG